MSERKFNICFSKSNEKKYSHIHIMPIINCNSKLKVSYWPKVPLPNRQLSGDIIFFASATALGVGSSQR